MQGDAGASGIPPPASLALSADAPSWAVSEASDAAGLGVEEPQAPALQMIPPQARAADVSRAPLIQADSVPYGYRSRRRSARVGTGRRYWHWPAQPTSGRPGCSSGPVVSPVWGTRRRMARRKETSQRTHVVHGRDCAARFGPESGCSAQKAPIAIGSSCCVSLVCGVTRQPMLFFILPFASNHSPRTIRAFDPWGCASGLRSESG